jgi:CheY-like chemotaxis protein
MTTDNGLHRHTVLIVDDEADMRESIAVILRADDYKIAAAASAEEALSIIDKSVPCLILMDVSMPGMGGSSCAVFFEACLKPPTPPSLS